jgi:hypothetical protein
MQLHFHAPLYTFMLVCLDTEATSIFFNKGYHSAK